MKKADILDHWVSLTPNQTIAPDPIPYKHEGSTFGLDGIRITGSKAFVDSVLSNIMDILDHENAGTRLQVNYQKCVDRATQEPIGGWSFYCTVRERGKG